MSAEYKNDPNPILLDSTINEHIDLLSLSCRSCVPFWLGTNVPAMRDMLETELVTDKMEDFLSAC